MYTYIQCLAIACSLFVTGILPLYHSYYPSMIAPYPVNFDCISNFELAFVMPLSVTHFYNWLEEQDDKHEALTIFGLHSEIRLYMQLCDDKEHKCTYGDNDWKQAERRIHAKALQIFEEYIIEDCKWSLINFHPNLFSVRKGRLSINSHHQSERPPLVHKDVSPIPTEILQEIRAGYRDGKIMFVLNNGLFSDVYIYTLERLRSYYN